MPTALRNVFIALALLLPLASTATAQGWRYLPEHSKDGRYAMALKRHVYLTHDTNLQIWVMQLALTGVTSTNNGSITFEREYGSSKRIEIEPGRLLLDRRDGESYDVVQLTVSYDMLEKMHDYEEFVFKVDGKSFPISLKGASYTLHQMNTELEADLAANLKSTNAATKKRAQTLKAMRECNRLTSHRWDQYRQAKAVKWSDIPATRAVSACEKAFRLRGPDARLTFQLGRAYDKAGNPDALKTLDGAAWDLEYPAAFYHLALLHADGTYTTKDTYAARRAYLEGWSYGHIPSAYALGRIDLKAATTSSAKADAIQLIRQAADAGYPNAMGHMGDLLFKGQITGTSRAEAVPYYKGASHEGNHKASYRLHKMYKNGNGIPADGLEANYYLLKAVSQGNKQAKKDWAKQ